MIHYKTDEVGSDEIEEVLQYSLDEYRRSSTSQNAGTTESGPNLGNERRRDLTYRLSRLDAEIADIGENIARLAKARDELIKERKKLVEEVQQTRTVSVTPSSKDKGKTRQSGDIDYTAQFNWSGALKMKMREVFNIDNFRLCQEGVCNANMDDRDIVCVMPTGGGKSLTYQLPALLVHGCTLVVSPLISLMQDQILHLKEAGVEAVMITGSTPKAQMREISDRLIAMSRDRDSSPYDIKLAYVTPEMLAKNKFLMSLLGKLNDNRRLARVVIDEAHCVSQMGHDYRPDYQKLNVLRTLFPNVPILALSATCPPAVLKDVMKILKMHQPLQIGNSASNEGTVYFSSPLYRKNLHYAVVHKPSGRKETVEAMKRYILDKHKNHSGIIYCLSKKDAEDVAHDLEQTSNNQIRTGVYHADVSDTRKEDLHHQWRKGAVQVVCATIAFGLGIDKGDVRFVLHHSIPKSVEGFYQESGRAGRDGKDADCVLYYRPQDATRLASLTVGELGAAAKLHQILEFAQDVEQCRKVQFAKYFNQSSDLAVASWSTAETGALERCGHCDNCTRDPELFKRRSVLLPAWQILKVVEAVHKRGGQVTMAQLSDLVRGNGGASFTANSRKRSRGGREKVELDLDEIAGGKVDLSKDETDVLVVNLLIKDYLMEQYQSTAYSTNVYLAPNSNAVRITRLSRADVELDKGPSLEYCFAVSKPARRGRLPTAKDPAPGSSGSKSKRIRRLATSESEEFAESGDGERRDDIEMPDEDGDEEEDYMDWQPSLRGASRKRLRSSGSSGRSYWAGGKGAIMGVRGDVPDVITIPSDSD